MSYFKVASPCVTCALGLCIQPMFKFLFRVYHQPASHPETMPYTSEIATTESGFRSTSLIFSFVHTTQAKPLLYQICPNRRTCPNRRAPPCSKKHITSNSYQILDKTSKDCPKTLKFERYSGLFGCRTCANRHFLVNKGPCGSCLPYICVL